MTLEPDEELLRAGFAHERPTALPPRLSVRIDRVPDDVRRLPSSPVRILRGVAPWAAAAAVTFLVVGWSSIVGQFEPRPGAAPGSWDPATTGGASDGGPLLQQWLPVVYIALLVGAILTAYHVRDGGTLIGPRGIRASLRASMPGPWRLRTRVLLLLLVFIPFAGAIWLRSWDPLWATEPFGPGPEVVDIRPDGLWRSDAIEHASSWSSGPGDRCVDSCPGPRYVYQVEPGEPFTYVNTIYNNGPLPITLVGRLTHESVIGPYGMARLRDPGLLSAEPENLLPFEPIDLAPGASVSVAIVDSGRACANPDAGGPPQSGMSGYPFVYDVLGWRRVGWVWPHFAVTVTGCF